MKHISWYKIRLVISSLLFVHSIQAQVDKNLISYFNFDSCTIRDAQNKATAASVGPLDCKCGIPGKSLSWNGGLNFAEWTSPGIQSMFSGNFSISFYLKPDPTTGTMDILSKRENCGIDSFFAIRYVVSERTLVAELVEKVDNNGTVKAILPLNTCWNHVVFTKTGMRLSLYINGEEKDSRTNNYTISMQNKAKLQLANSPCLAISDIRFKGGLDELRLYDRALTRDEVKSLYKLTDKILNKDTVIFKGGNVNVRLAQTCASEYQWTPSTNVSNPILAEPALTPEVTRVYTLKTNQGNCFIQDTLKITVIDASNLNCNDVKLPTAFTPNQDGLNDVYKISNPYVVEAIQAFEVFDRWGEKLFSTVDGASGWDGTFRNSPVNPGLFVYHLKYLCQGKTKHKSGSFTLIR